VYEFQSASVVRENSTEANLALLRFDDASLGSGIRALSSVYLCEVFMRIAWLLGVALVCVASPVAAQVKPTSPVFVLDLYDPRNRFVVVSAASFDDALRDPAAQATAKRSPEEAATDLAATDSPLDRIVSACSVPKKVALNISETTSADLAHPVAKLQRCMNCLVAFQEKRFITERNDEVPLIVLFNGATVTAEQIRPFFEETPRRSELLATGKALFELLRAEATPRLSCAAFTYTLQHQRSHFRVVVPLPQGAVPSSAPAAAPGAAPAPAPAANAGPAAASPPVSGGLKTPTAGFAAGAAVAATGAPPQVTSPQVVLGPREHWFFSADFSIDKASVDLGETPTPDAKELKAKSFFVALNFALSDLLADRESPMQRRNLLKELLLKVQVTPSKKPWESWAVGVGVRGYRLKTLLWNFDVAHPYITFGRQQDEGEEARWRAVFGIGFDPRSLAK
jgi:hypothetical protein